MAHRPRRGHASTKNIDSDSIMSDNDLGATAVPSSINVEITTPSGNPTQNFIGYVPQKQNIIPPKFLGSDKTDFSMWQVRFEGFLLKKGESEDVLDIKKNISPTKNRQIYADIVEAIDDVSLALILTNARNNGQKAYKILED